MQDQFSKKTIRCDCALCRTVKVDLSRFNKRQRKQHELWLLELFALHDINFCKTVNVDFNKLNKTERSVKIMMLKTELETQINALNVVRHGGPVF